MCVWRPSVRACVYVCGWCVRVCVHGKGHSGNVSYYYYSYSYQLATMALTIKTVTSIPTDGLHGQKLSLGLGRLASGAELRETGGLPANSGVNRLGRRATRPRATKGSLSLFQPRCRNIALRHLCGTPCQLTSVTSPPCPSSRLV